MKNNILVIGIAGGTGSGKTTLMNNLIAEFSDVVTILSHDNYYKRHDELTYEQRCAGGRPSTARYTISPCTTGPTRPSGLCPRRSSLWRAF